MQIATRRADIARANSSISARFAEIEAREIRVRRTGFRVCHRGAHHLDLMDLDRLLDGDFALLQELQDTQSAAMDALGVLADSTGLLESELHVACMEDINALQ